MSNGEASTPPSGPLKKATVVSGFDSETSSPLPAIPRPSAIGVAGTDFHLSAAATRRAPIVLADDGTSKSNNSKNVEYVFQTVNSSNVDQQQQQQSHGAENSSNRKDAELNVAQQAPVRDRSPVPSPYGGMKRKQSSTTTQPTPVSSPQSSHGSLPQSPISSSSSSIPPSTSSSSFSTLPHHSPSLDAKTPSAGAEDENLSSEASLKELDRDSVLSASSNSNFHTSSSYMEEENDIELQMANSVGQDRIRVGLRNPLNYQKEVVYHSPPIAAAAAAASSGSNELMGVPDIIMTSATPIPKALVEESTPTGQPSSSSSPSPSLSGLQKQERQQEQATSVSDGTLENNDKEESYFDETELFDDEEEEARTVAVRVYKCFKTSGRATISKTVFFKQLEEVGIYRDDPRLKQSLHEMSKSDENMTFDEFYKYFRPDWILLSKALQGQMVIPDFKIFCKDIEEIYQETIKNTDGHVATYIPQLARVNPDQYAVSICTIDGQRYQIGDVTKEFCVQSCSKPISYCLALEERGEKKVHQHVGREPSGVRFNELALNHEGKPHNPLINAGAIMTCSLIQPKMDMADRFTHVVDYWTRLSGGAKIGFSNPTYLSERQTADRNYALAYFMRENKGFPVEVEKKLNEILEFYFQCCSLECNAEALAVISATLANGGTCPMTNERVFRPETVRACLSMMYSCGMYDYSGEFAFKIGIPAKSGVAGALMIVVPNVMGICTWSPRLDKLGNSVRGVEFCKILCQKFNFHNFDESIATHGKRDPRLVKDHQKHRHIMEMCFAASQGDLSAIRRLVQKGGSLNACDYDGRTPMHLAASEGHERLIHYLVHNGADINPLDRWRHSPMDDAIREGQDRVVAILKANGAATGVEILSRMRSASKR